MLQSIWTNSRLRGEVGWVLSNKVGEVGLHFLAVKLFTNILGKAIYAEYSLVLNAAQVVYAATMVPIHEAYLRYHHTATADGVVGHAGRIVIRWCAVVTVVVATLAAVVSVPLSGRANLGTWTIMAGGIAFLSYHWRRSGVEILDMKRQRRAVATQNLSFLMIQITLVSLVNWYWTPAAYRALLSHALVAAVFGAIAIRPFFREVFTQPVERKSDIRGMVLRFGVPYGLLRICQWVQGFSERFILWAQLDPATVGLYVAAYPLCGVPYMLTLAVYRALLVPVAYQRAKDIRDPGQVWAADKVLLIGAAAYVVFGAMALPVYLLLGARLLTLLTNADFVLPSTTLLAIATARYMQSLGGVFDAFFAVHQRMANSLSFRLVGGLVVVPICWFAIQEYALLGAALGVLVASAIYILVACFGPGGCFHLVYTARREALALARSDGERKEGS